MKQKYSWQELKELVQAAPPMLLLDRAEIDQGNASAEAVKAVSMNEEFFLGHFPGSPIMPGVLQVGAIAQLAEVMFKSMHPSLQGHTLQVISAERVKFRKPVVPGDIMRVSVEHKEDSDAQGCFSVSGKVEVGGTAVCQGKLTLQVFNPQELEKNIDLTQIGKLPHFPDLEIDPNNYFGVEEITRIIPHRYPFLLLDRILYLDKEESRVIMAKNITGNESFMTGLKNHAVPLWIQAEMGAQGGCFLALHGPENEGRIGYFMAIDKAVSHMPVNPGEQLIVDIRMNKKGNFGKGVGNIYAGTDLASEFAVKFVLVER